MIYTETLKSFFEKAGEEQKKNSHGVLSSLKNCFAPVKVEEGFYTRISTKGEFNLFDYGAGLYCVKIFTCAHSLEQDGAAKPNIKWSVKFHVGNLDDMSWGAWSKFFDTKEEAVVLAEKLAPILEDLAVMPTEKELNEALRPFGMYGECEP